MAGELLEEMLKMQEASGENYLSPSAVKILSAKFGLSEYQVLDAATFYKELSLEPRGRYVIRICKSPCCHFAGGKEVKAVLTEVLGINIGETTADKGFTLEETGCIGACDEAPAMRINEKIYGGLNEEKIRLILDELKREMNQ